MSEIKLSSGSLDFDVSDKKLTGTIKDDNNLLNLNFSLSHSEGMILRDKLLEIYPLQDYSDYDIEIDIASMYEELLGGCQVSKCIKNDVNVTADQFKQIADVGQKYKVILDYDKNNIIVRGLGIRNNVDNAVEEIEKLLQSFKKDNGIKMSSIMVYTVQYPHNLDDLDDLENEK